MPNTWDFYHVADNATEKDQDLFFSGSVDNQTTPDFHQSARYGMTRKREQYNLWSQSGSGVFDTYGDSFGDPVTIAGANGYSVSGPALLDFAGPIRRVIRLFPIAIKSATRAITPSRRTLSALPDFITSRNVARRRTAPISRL